MAGTRRRGRTWRNRTEGELVAMLARKYPAPAYALVAQVRDSTGGGASRTAEALANLPHVVSYLFNECPGSCWGSPDRVKAWLSRPANQLFEAPAEELDDTDELADDTDYMGKLDEADPKRD